MKLQKTPQIENQIQFTIDTINDKIDEMVYNLMETIDIDEENEDLHYEMYHEIRSQITENL